MRYQNNYQTILAIIVTIELHVWVSSKFKTGTVSGDESHTQLVGSSAMGILYEVTLCYVVGASVTLETLLLIIMI